jgi:hypothetical protein
MPVAAQSQQFWLATQSEVVTAMRLPMLGLQIAKSSRTICAVRYSNLGRIERAIRLSRGQGSRCRHRIVGQFPPFRRFMRCFKLWY